MVGEAASNCGGGRLRGGRGAKAVRSSARRPRVVEAGGEGGAGRRRREEEEREVEDESA